MASRTTVRTAVLLVLFFISGVAALIYEVLWLKELGLLFGVTAYAAAATLAVFFLGLSCGNLVWGRESAVVKRPLRVYAFLELAIAGSAMVYFWLLDLYHLAFPYLFRQFGHQPALMVVVKLMLATGVLFLPAFFMGGTLPVMGQYLIGSPTELGRKASALYAINTLGAAVGALAAGFYLPQLLGFRVSYALAIGLNLVVFVVAFAWDKISVPGEQTPAEPTRRPSRSNQAVSMSPTLLGWVAFASGFLTLGLEVLWTRMFSQVLQNSVYTFSAILTVFLAALACGSVVAHVLSRWRLRTDRVLVILLMLSAAAVFLTPFTFYRLTAGLNQLGSDLGWSGYLLAVFGATASVLLIPGLLIGSIFPYLMKASEGWMRSAGRTIGHLAAVNTAAAILGSLVAGFLILNWVGLWAGIGLMAMLYLILALIVSWQSLREGWRWPVVVGAASLALVVSGTIGYRGLEAVNLAENEEVVWLRDGPHGTVSVVQRDEDLRLKVNNHYLLGTAASTPNQRVQSWIPLSLHPYPRSVFYLGMGTGITAGGALDFPVERVVVTEINPDVIAASRAWFAPYLNGLFEDPRVQVLAEDGRVYLAATEDSFDVIVGDIFLTYRAGVGSLYTLEHFQAVSSRLASGGLFAQWLPMFDLSQEEFGIIAGTMLEVFPQVSLWRRSISPIYPVYALIASNESEPLDAERFGHHLVALESEGITSSRLWLKNIPLAAFAGNLSAVRAHFESYPLSTDDRRQLEYLAPRTERDSKGSGTKPTLALLPLAEFCEQLLDQSDPLHDHYLSNVSESGFRDIEAGLEIYKSEAYRRLDEVEASAHARARYESLIAGTTDAFSDDR